MQRNFFAVAPKSCEVLEASGVSVPKTSENPPESATFSNLLSTTSSQRQGQSEDRTTATRTTTASASRGVGQNEKHLDEILRVRSSRESERRSHRSGSRTTLSTTTSRTRKAELDTTNTNREYVNHFDIRSRSRSSSTKTNIHRTNTTMKKSISSASPRHGVGGASPRHNQHSNSSVRLGPSTMLSPEKKLRIEYEEERQVLMAKHREEVKSLQHQFHDEMSRTTSGLKQTHESEISELKIKAIKSLFYQSTP